MGKDNKFDSEAAASAGGAEAGASAPFALDPAEYREDLAMLDLSDEQERIFLETLWSILSTFVELGFKGEIATILCKHFMDVSRSGEDEVKLSPSSAITGASRSGKDIARHE